MSEDNLFEEKGLEIVEGEVSVGETYPIYGMITKIIDESLPDPTVQINFNIQAKLSITDSENFEVLRNRVFEPGIFVSTILEKDPSVKVDCHTVIFGRKQDSPVC